MDKQNILNQLIEKAKNELAQMQDSYKKTKDLVVSYKKLAENEDVLYINPNTEIKVDEEEGIHIDITNHKKLAELIYEAMKLWKK